MPVLLSIEEAKDYLYDDTSSYLKNNFVSKIEEYLEYYAEMARDHVGLIVDQAVNRQYLWRFEMAGFRGLLYTLAKLMGDYDASLISSSCIDA
jgi:hypothetical protein